MSACRSKRWHLVLWNPLDPELKVQHVPWSCRSWRHEGACRLWRGASDFQRVRKGIGSLDKWSSVVLTFAQGDWPSPWHQYRASGVLWSYLRKRLDREFGHVNYIQTWERFQKGGIHVNIALSNVDFSYRLENFGRENMERWLRPHARACGFGWRLSVKPMTDEGQLAGYMTKLAKELTGCGAKNQVPLDAPPHFRRLRASHGVLPPAYTSELTGLLLRTSMASFLKASESGYETKVIDGKLLVLTPTGELL